jgi:hypothetical protein
MSSAAIWQGVAVQLEAAAAALSAAGAVNGAGSLLGAGSAAFSFGASGGYDAVNTMLVGGLATGGFVSGPGTPTSDSIPAMLSNGEYVFNAAAVRKYGVGFLNMMNEGKIPHKKHGGLLGTLLPFLAGGLFGFLTHSPLGVLGGAGLIGGGFTLANKIHGPLGDILKFAISPAAFVAEELLGGHSSSKIPTSMLSALSPGAAAVAANNNDRPDGDSYNINVPVQGGGNSVKNRETGLQIASGIATEIARKRAKGTI